MVTAEFDGNFAEMKSKCGRSVEWWRQHQEAIQTREPNFYCSVVGFVKATLTLLTVKKTTRKIRLQVITCFPYRIYLMCSMKNNSCSILYLFNSECLLTVDF